MRQKYQRQLLKAVESMWEKYTTSLHSILSEQEKEIGGLKRNIICLPHLGILMKKTAKNPRPDRFENKISQKAKSEIEKIKKQAIKSNMKHFDLSAYPRILLRIKYKITGPENSTKFPMISYRHR